MTNFLANQNKTILILRGWPEKSWVISVSDPVLLPDKQEATTCGLKSPGRSIYEELRYASDMRAAEWAQIAPLLPPPCRLGRPRAQDLRAIVDAILYLLWTGCQWRALPREFPCARRSRVTSTAAGATTAPGPGSAQLVARRLRAGREPVPSAGIIDSQSAPTTERRSARHRRRQAHQGTQAPSSPIPRASCSPPWSMKPISKTRTARYRCCVAAPSLPRPGLHLRRSHLRRAIATGCRALRPLDDPDRRAPASVPRLPTAAPPMGRRRSAPSPGSVEADAWPKTSKLLSLAPPREAPAGQISGLYLDASPAHDANSSILVGWPDPGEERLSGASR